MRQLNNIEIDICKQLLLGDGDNNYLSNIIDHQLHGVLISIDRSNQKVDLLFTIQNQIPSDKEQSESIRRNKEVSILLLTAINLIKMLEKEGYIILIQRANIVPNNSKFGMGVGNLPNIEHNFPDVELNKLFIEYVDKEIFVTEEFRHFCNHGFIARDEHRFRRQFMISTIALSIAVIALLSNLFFNLLPSFENGTKINQDQMDLVSKDLILIENKIDSLNLLTKKLIQIQSANNFTNLKENGKTRKRK